MLIEFCAFCRTTLEQNKKESINEGHINSQLCLGCFQNVLKLDHDDITTVDQDSFDNLPYGTIILDKYDNIVNYNETESKISGFDKSDVIGKNFFEDIAPCTSVKKFRGRLDEMRDERIAQQTQMNITFNHDQFFAEVSILLTYQPIGRHTIISVQKLSEVEEDETPLSQIDEF